MNLQNLNDAVKLYEILGKYIPENVKQDAFDFVNEIFENIKKSGNYEVYFDAIQVMTGKTQDQLTILDPVAVLEIFVNAMIDWHVVELVTFFKGIGYKNDRPK